MAFQDVIAAETDAVRTDEATDSEGAGDEPAKEPGADGRAYSPFSMQYDLDSYEIDAETADQLLSVLVAVTNLL